MPSLLEGEIGSPDPGRVATGFETLLAAPRSCLGACIHLELTLDMDVVTRSMCGPAIDAQRPPRLEAIRINVHLQYQPPR